MCVYVCKRKNEKRNRNCIIVREKKGAAQHRAHQIASGVSAERYNDCDVMITGRAPVPTS